MGLRKCPTYYMVSSLPIIGFQTASHARHFRQTISRILSLEALPKGIQIEGTSGSGTGAHKGRFIDIGLFPGYRRQSAAGEEVGLIVRGNGPVLAPMTWTLMRWHRREPDVQIWVQLLRQRYAGMKMIVGRDTLDEIQVWSATAICVCPSHVGSS